MNCPECDKKMIMIDDVSGFDGRHEIYQCQKCHKIIVD